MNRVWMALTIAALATGPAAAEEPCKTCGYGTKIEFLDSPKEAAALALKQDKLVLVLHVSGHFEDPGLT